MDTRRELSDERRPSAQRRAVIDVGTNSVKLLVAEVAGHTVHPLLEQSEQTRLGAGFYDTHRLQAEPIAHTARVVARFAAEAGKLHATTLRCIATSAARDAENAAELHHAIAHAAGLPLEIISGEQEADWAFHGVTSDPAFAGAPLLLLDVGGGSTEFILGVDGEVQFRRSFPLGSVRLLEQFPLHDPPAESELAACRAHLKQFLAQEVLSPLSANLGAGRGRPARSLVGTGGATTILARMRLQSNEFDRAQIEATRFSGEEIRRETTRLWGLPLAARRQIAGLPPNRADVILFGVAIYEAVMNELDFAELRVSTRGLRFGAVLAG